MSSLSVFNPFLFQYLPLYMPEGIARCQIIGPVRSRKGVVIVHIDFLFHVFTTTLTFCSTSLHVHFSRMSTENASDFENLRKKFGRFRILIVGRANAGKTTILRGICNTTENPEIHDGDGNKIDPSQVEGSRGRGMHNIENELIFRSNNKFVFHDSQGFEAGRKDEFLRMKEFIANRAKTTFLKKRLHAIWYCIPMDKLD
ncbi:hypothetical protein OG21DRAFT_503459 [Imleria badia]|nr:hypothetical protein OG21DRAFT_503459 [Imleria badia]